MMWVWEKVVWAIGLQGNKKPRNSAVFLNQNVLPKLLATKRASQLARHHTEYRTKYGWNDD